MFWQARNSGIDDSVFIIDGDRKYTFNDIFRIGDSMLANISERSVLIIEAERDIGTVCAYIGALRNNIVPLLIDSNLSADRVMEIANSYQAENIICTNTGDHLGYRQAGVYGTKAIYSRTHPPLVQVHEDLCMLLPTSGSTGEAKCVRTSRENLLLATQSIVRYLEMNETRVSISSLPLHYTYGLSTLNCALESRSRFVLSKHSWLEREFWAIAEKHGVTDLSGVPFMFQTLRRIRLPETLLNNLVCVNQAGGRLEPVLTEYFIDYFSERRIKYFTMYGATEASPRISYVPHHISKQKLGTVGIPIDIGSFRTDAHDGVSEGELIYEGPNVCLGYAYTRDDLVLGDENSQTLHTGDLAYIDSDGYATIIGRKKRFVKIFGISVNLDAVESIVRAFNTNSAVIGEDDRILVLITEGDPALAKQNIQKKVTFSNRGFEVKKVAEIYLTPSGKPDYQRMKSEFL